MSRHQSVKNNIFIRWKTCLTAFLKYLSCFNPSLKTILFYSKTLMKLSVQLMIIFIILSTLIDNMKAVDLQRRGAVLEEKQGKALSVITATSSPQSESGLQGQSSICNNIPPYDACRDSLLRILILSVEGFVLIYNRIRTHVFLFGLSTPSVSILLRTKKLIRAWLMDWDKTSDKR